MTNQTPEKLYFSPEEACDFLNANGLPRTTVNSLAVMRHRGQGPAYTKPGPKLVVYKRDALIRFIEGGGL